MSNKNLLDNIKKLREMTGVGFKDCKVALEENNGEIEKSIEFLRKKGIAKASKKMLRTASEGLALISEENGEVAIIEINSETDFVAKNQDFINFCKELSALNFKNKGDLEKLNNTKMSDGILVKDGLINLISKIGEKITIRRAKFFNNSSGHNFFYIHSAIEKNIGKIISIIKLENIDQTKGKDLGNKLAMHIAASNPLAIDKDGIDQKIIDKEIEIIQAEILNSGKPKEIAEKISKGKISKFLNDNSLLNQIWIMDTNKTVKEILKDNSGEKQIKIIDYIRYKVGEGI
tara:strand:- start:477 stop:1343 length:867 start_codon:yes stop_codon:yes gene_type:complete